VNYLKYLYNLVKVEIIFKSQILFDLYEGRVVPKKHFSSIPMVVKKFQSVIVIFKNIEKLTDLYIYPGLHYEKLKGNLNRYSSIRLNKKYRLIFRELQNNIEPGIVDTLEIIEISNHYS